MIIAVRKSLVSGNINSKEIDATEEQLKMWCENSISPFDLNDWAFIISGATDEEWRNLWRFEVE